MYNYGPLLLTLIKCLGTAARNDGEMLPAANIGETLDMPSSVRGLRALHFAALAGHADIVSILISHGASMYTCDDRGRTPLHCAQEMGFTELVASMGGTSQGLAVQASLSPRSNTLTAEAESPTDMSVDEFLPAEGEGGGRESEDSSYSQSPTGQNTTSQSLDHREALNRELLLDAFQQLSLHDRCALSLSLDHSRSPPPEHVQQSDSDVDIFSDIGSVISDADVAEAIGSEDGIKAAIDVPCLKTKRLA